MPTLTRAQIEVYARAAGLPVPLFVDIAMAESSGRTEIVNSIGCVGLWQINQPVHVLEHPTWTRRWLQDPMNNARAAATLYRARGTQPWLASQAKWGGSSASGGSGGDGGGLTGFLGGAAGAVTGVTGGVLSLPGEAASAALETAQGVARVAGAVERAGTWISTPANVVRVVYVAGGALLVLVAVNQVITLPAVTKVVAVVGGATSKVGKVGKGAGKGNGDE